MNKFHKLIISIVIVIASNLSGYATDPTFDMSIRNITTVTNPAGGDSILFFDVYIRWTNSAVSNPFEWALSDGAILINHQIFNGGVQYGLNSAGSFTKYFPITSDMPIIEQPPTTKCTTFDAEKDLLLYSPNFPHPEVNFLISTDYPGTRLMRFQLRTTAHSWSPVSPDLSFRLGPSFHTLLFYFLPSVDPKDPDHQLIDSIPSFENNFFVESNFPLPVELSNFNAQTHKNIITLNWTTTLETNNQGFNVERKISSEGNWVKTAFISGNGTSGETKNYTFSERLSIGNYNYRLKQIDFNGNFKYYNLDNEVIVGIPASYSLSQNYPNPFNPSTKIDFELPYDGKVSLILFDINGREISKLINEVNTAGYYTAEFNASNLSSGIYFYRINAEGNGQNFVQTKKMMLIK